MAYNKVTLAHVAIRAGVSKGTASHILNDTRKMSAATTLRVKAVADQLGYRADSHARALSVGRPETIGVIVADAGTDMVAKAGSTFWSSMAFSLIQECSDQGYLVSCAGQDRLTDLTNGGVDVLAVMGAPDHDLFASVSIPYGMPVLSGVPIEGADTHIVAHDADAIAGDVVGEMVAQGGSHVAWVSVDSAQIPTGRWDAAMRAQCAAAGVEYSSAVFDGSQRTLNETVARLIADGVDAFFGLIGNTANLLTAIEATGKSCPNDVLVIVQGEGHVEAAMRPEVTLLSLCPFEIGAVIAKLCHKLIQREIKPGDFSTVLPHKLIAKQSSRPERAVIPMARPA